jgi:imidazolonepropionase-like amidohydrolase
MRSRSVVPHLVVVCMAVVMALPLTTQYVTAQNPPPYYAITNARIVPVSGPVIEKGTVVIANGIIRAVGENVTIPPEAWVMDGEGLTVYPGLIDAYTDLGLVAAQPPRPGGPPGAAAQQQQRQSEGPEDRPGSTPWENAADELKADDRRLETWRNAGFTTALSAPRIGIFPGQAAVINLAGDRPGQMVVLAPAALPISFRPTGDFWGFPGSLMGTLAYIKQVFHDTEHYAAAQAAYDASPSGQRRPDYDRTVRAISAARGAGLPVLLPGDSATEIRRAMMLAGQIGLEKYVIYGAQQGYEVAAELAGKKVPVLVGVKWPERERDADPEAEEMLRALRHRARAPSTPAELAKAGVKFAFYSDEMSNPRDVLKNTKRAIDAGLDAGRALRALTLDAAEIFGVADRLGSIEAGKIANLTIADGDLFDEKTKIKWVFVDGRRFEIRETEPTRPSGGAANGAAANISGTWQMTIEAPDGTQAATARFTQASDGSVTGTMDTSVGPVTITGGSVTGNRVRMNFTMAMGDGTINATVEGNRMTGTIAIGEFAIDFSATRSGPGGSLAGAERE